MFYVDQPRRGCGSKPKVAAFEQPWETSEKQFTTSKRLWQNRRPMPQALSAVYFHLVFSTKERRPWLRDKSTRDALHAFLGAASRELDCPPLIVGGVEDHV